MAFERNPDQSWTVATVDLTDAGNRTDRMVSPAGGNDFGSPERHVSAAVNSLRLFDLENLRRSDYGLVIP
jgi:hypothetical protein